MIINYSDSTIMSGRGSIFLAGPTPRDINIPSWRDEACAILSNLGFNGIVYVPEYSDRKPLKDYLGQVEWERQGLSTASIIAFWIPRTLPHLSGFTTNVEFGYYLHTGKILYGRPDESEKNRYLDWLYEKDTGLKPHTNLKDLLIEAISKVDFDHPIKKSEFLPINQRIITTTEVYDYEKERRS